MQVSDFFLQPVFMEKFPKTRYLNYVIRGINAISEAVKMKFYWYSVLFVQFLDMTGNYLYRVWWVATHNFTTKMGPDVKATFKGKVVSLRVLLCWKVRIISNRYVILWISNVPDYNCLGLHQLQAHLLYERHINMNPKILKVIIINCLGGVRVSVIDSYFGGRGFEPQPNRL